MDLLTAAAATGLSLAGASHFASIALALRRVARDRRRLGPRPPAAVSILRPVCGLPRGAGRRSAVSSTLGRRALAGVWQRQLRWARLRRLSFPGSFCAELPGGGVFPFLLGGWLAAEGILPWVGIVAIALAWYGAEALLARAFGWRCGVRSPLFWVARDLLLPVLWTRAWAVKDYEWRGTAVDVALTIPAPGAPSGVRARLARLLWFSRQRT
jgi:hypothetical protein